METFGNNGGQRRDRPGTPLLRAIRAGDGARSLHANDEERDENVWLSECLRAAYPTPQQLSVFPWRRADGSPFPMPQQRDAAMTEEYSPQADITAICETLVDLTEISFEPEAPSRDRRTDDRSKVRVYRAATIRWREFEGLCLIRNISPGGVMGKIHTSLPRGERVTVEIRSGQPIPGSVAWSRDGQTGIQFDERIDVLQVLHAPSSGERGMAQRMPRVRIACPAQLIIEGARLKALLVDVSQGGAKIEADTLVADHQVTLHIQGLEARRGVVRWARDGWAGIAFLNPIGFDQLAQWALDRQAEAGKA